LVNALRRNRKENFIILGNHCFLARKVSELTLGGEFREEMGLKENEFREKGLPDTQIITMVRVFLFFPIV